MPPKVRPRRTYKKVITKRSGKTKTKDISEKKYKRKLKRAVKSEARGKKKKVTGTTTTSTRLIRGNTTTKRQTISKKKKGGRKKTFVGTASRAATKAEVRRTKVTEALKQQQRRQVPRLNPILRSSIVKPPPSRPIRKAVPKTKKKVKSYKEKVRKKR